MSLPRQWGLAAYLCAAALLVTLVFRTAWLCDDAYITARTIDNWLHGYGLRWNVVERVQTFTHPLWLLVEAAAWRVSGGPYWSLMALSIVCAASGAVLLTLVGGVSLAGAAALLALSASQAFVDFASSGLETPLTYLLLAAFLLEYWRGRSSPAWILGTTTMASLLAVNRLDTLVLVAPALVHVMVVAARSKRTVQFLLGLAPLLLWEAFSVAYYGFPVPNTAFAKLATGVPQAELTTQGVAYLLNSWRVDPPTLIVIGGAVLAALWGRRLEALTVAGGLLLHLVYVVRVGGDFMSGRFLAPAVLMAAGVILYEARTQRREVHFAALLVVVAAIGLPKAVERAWWSRPFPPVDSLIDAHGIADERMVYARDTSLLRAMRRGAAPELAWVAAGRQAAAAGVTAMSRDSVGMFGYGAGPSVQLVDTLALCDPLLARLPADRPWRIGHFHRPIPSGYIQMLRGRQARLDDPALDAYYAALRRVTRDPLWSRARWKAILVLNTSRRLAPAP